MTYEQLIRGKRVLLIGGGRRIEQGRQDIVVACNQHWAKSYKDRVARLTKEGRMHEAGLEVVEAAKESGMWDFMNDVDAM